MNLLFKIKILVAESQMCTQEPRSTSNLTSVSTALYLIFRHVDTLMNPTACPIRNLAHPAKYNSVTIQCHIERGVEYQGSIHCWHKMRDRGGQVPMQTLSKTFCPGGNEPPGRWRINTSLRGWPLDSSNTAPAHSLRSFSPLKRPAKFRRKDPAPRQN